MLPEPLDRPLRRVAFRVRAQRMLDAGVTIAVASVGATAVALGLVKLGLLSEESAVAMLAVACSAPIAAATLAGLRPVSRIAAARMLDRAHGTDGRIAAAVELARQPDAWARAAVHDALALAKRIAPRRAAPWHVPRNAAPAAALASGVALLAALEIPARVELPVRAGLVPLVLHEDDLDAYEVRLRDLLDATDLDPDVAQQAHALNRLLEDLADRRIDRNEALRRLAEVEARLDARPPADATLLRDELRAMGQALRGASLAETLAQALRDDDLAAAERAMHQIAARLRTDPPSRAEIERLRRALEEAARQSQGDDADRLAQHEQETQRLLRRNQERGASEPDQRRLLEMRRRELERLRRESERHMEARRRLERLARELSEAAADLAAGDEEGGADDLDEGAEDFNRMAREQLTEAQIEELERQLQELRELIRRQRELQQAGGGSRDEGQRGTGERSGSERMDRFVLRARGGGGRGIPVGVPDPDGSGGQEQRGGDRHAGGGERVEGGEGPGASEAQQMLVLGQGGSATLELPGLGHARREQAGAGGGSEPAASGAGSEHAPARLDDPTHLADAHRTVQVRGVQTRGPTRSEVIRSAAQQGFASRDYARTYTEYAEHAEEAIERDRVPPGYRFYVRRYFQLIRPRDGE